MSNANIGLTPLHGYGLTPAQLKLPADPQLVPDAHRWLFFDITQPHVKYVLNQSTGYYMPLALGVQPISAPVSASYTLAMSDAGSVVDMNFAGANTITVPNDTVLPLPVGVVIDVTASGAGATTIAAGSGASIVKAAADSFTISGQHKTARLRKIAANTWRVSAN